jgi:inosine/xanthosine triphosphatase
MDRKIIAVSSHNPVKAAAVRRGFGRMFPDQQFKIQTISVSSGVGDQPFSNQETLRGALNRANYAAQHLPKADYWVGVEGGIEDQNDGMIAFAWVVVQSDNLLGKGRTGTFYLPPRIAKLIRQGIELGDADDIVFGKSNSKQNNGAVGLLTGNVIDRTRLYETAVILALLPFKNPDLYQTTKKD